jgi:tRNA threonylcarbamoyladenosine biosynthesis protein TsaE
MILMTRGPAATETLGRVLGTACRGGEIVGLIGPLGSGKTCLARGVAAGLGIDPRRVRSPSFTWLNEHHGRLPLFHIDLYRLDSIAADELWLRECLFGSGVAVVEWFERLTGLETEDHLRVRLDVVGPEERRLDVVATGARHRRLVAALVAHGDIEEGR